MKFFCDEDQIYRGPLILVNQAHPFRSAKPPHLAAVDRRAPAVLLDGQASLLLSFCLQMTEGGEEIFPVSGWRSFAEQQHIWDVSAAKNGLPFTRQFVAAPGCSEHETGFAIDLALRAEEIDFIRPNFPHCGVCNVFRRLALQYGFIERYPAGKESLTGIEAEPWHFRYVGIPHAAVMAEHGLCLEEYVDFVRKDPVCYLMDNGSTAEIFYVPYPGKPVEVSVSDGVCLISGNNVDGFIITIWRQSV